MKQKLWLTIITGLAYCIGEELCKASDYLRELVRSPNESEERFHLVDEILWASADRPPDAALRNTALRRAKWVTEWVSRHVVVTCYRVVSDLLPTCKPHFRPKISL